MNPNQPPNLPSGQAPSQSQYGQHPSQHPPPQQQQQPHTPQHAHHSHSHSQPHSHLQYVPSPTAPQITLDSPSNAPANYHPPSAVPNILQPGRPPAMPANTAPSSVPTMQSNEYASQTPPKPSSFTIGGGSHGYSNSIQSPAAATTTAGYDGSLNYMPYTPTTPSGGPSSSTTPHFIPSNDIRYASSFAMPNAQRRVSNTPLGLADIRPRADSSLSDGLPGCVADEISLQKPGTSNYMAPWALYAFDWCKLPPRVNNAGKVAVGSYLEDGHNFIQVLDAQVVPTPAEAYVPGTSKQTMEFTKIAEATHSYPVTRLLWEPPSQSSQQQSRDLLATSGDHLRLWSLPAEISSAATNSITSRPGRDVPVTKLTPLALLSNSKTPDHTAPLTSLDWNTISPSLIITSSIDTTCTIWDIPLLTAKTQLIAHDKEVYDVRFCAHSVDVFVSCGQDGSVRMFDLRSLEHSTIIYEPSNRDERDINGGRISPTLAQQTMSTAPPLLRIATSPHEGHLLATFAQDSNVIRVLDIRQPGQALCELRGHGGPVNCVEWSPLRRGVLASGADDCQVLLWDLTSSTSILPPSHPPPTPTTPSGGGGTNTAPGGRTNGGGPPPENARSPVAAWQCDYEINNLGWVPQLTQHMSPLPHMPSSGPDQGDWLGVCAARGLWSVRV